MFEEYGQGQEVSQDQANDVETELTQATGPSVGPENSVAMGNLANANVPTASEGDIEGRVASSVWTPDSGVLYLNRGEQHGVKRGMWVLFDVNAASGPDKARARIQSVFATRCKATFRTGGKWTDGTVDSQTVTISESKPSLKEDKGPEKPSVEQSALILSKAAEANGYLSIVDVPGAEVDHKLMYALQDLQGLVSQVGKGLPLDAIAHDAVKDVLEAFDEKLKQPWYKKQPLPIRDEDTRKGIFGACSALSVYAYPIE